MTLPAQHAARRDTLGPEYRELHGPLLRFAEGLVGNRADAEEAVHDAFAAALGRDRLDDPRAWPREVGGGIDRNYLAGAHRGSRKTCRRSSRGGRRRQGRLEVNHPR